MTHITEGEWQGLRQRAKADERNDNNDEFVQLALESFDEVGLPSEWEDYDYDDVDVYIQGFIAGWFARSGSLSLWRDARRAALSTVVFQDRP